MIGAITEHSANEVARLNMTSIKLVTFDVYSALLDIHGGLTDALSDASQMAPQTVQPIVATWRLKQMERAAASNSLGGNRISFRDCTRYALDYVCSRHNLTLTAEAREKLVFAWDRLPLWPEADAAIRDAKALGYRVAILSNGDQAMLDAVAGLFSTNFDDVLSSEAAGHYKPHASVYALPCIWSNKTCDSLLDPRYPPRRVIENLAALRPLLEAQINDDVLAIGQM